MTETALMAALRDAKREAALLIALRDLFGAADTRQTTFDLSDLADAALGAAIRLLLRDLHRAGKIALPQPERPEAESGFFVLGLGKLGARELNYSSDIDLIVLFDPDAPGVIDREASAEVFSRLVRRLVRIIGERTGDGYVFRTDLRIRPDPASMPLAIPVPAALAYYETSGRTWERAALIKARCVAGDRRAAERFIGDLTPFVWRKYLDFNAIDEIRTMKGRIDRHRGLAGVGVLGHDVKLGHGGIREAEFFVQAQQLIAGGRNPELRLRRTDDALDALAGGGWISAPLARSLTESYWFLRRVEHAVQMIDDEQSHTLPETDAELERVARLLGFADAAMFSDAILEHMRAVRSRFDDLFADFTAASGGNDLVRLMESESDPSAVAELTRLGYRRPQSTARIVRTWGEGRYRATRAPAARACLVKVLPDLVRALATAADPDGALAAFDAFLAGLPAGLQFFSLIAANPKILDLVVLIIAAAPRLAATLSRRPHVFDAFLDPTFFHSGPAPRLLRGRLRAFLADAGTYEERLARLRLFASEQQFLVGVRLLSGTIDGPAAGSAYSDIADVAIAETLAVIEKAFAERHGRVPGGRLALFGMGRLGSREMTAGSDVDLILFYEHPLTQGESGGEKPLTADVYYARLTQRLIAALSAPMGEGILYDVDFRLRPSGNKGPLATHVDAFRRYQATEARTWERMALTRSRFIAGDRPFGDDVAATIRSILSAPRDRGGLARDIADMRALIEREKPSRGLLDMKLRRGGLVDLEFLAQWALLAGSVPPALVGRPTADVLDALDIVERRELVGISRDFACVLQLMRLGPDRAASAGALPSPLLRRIADALDVADVEAAIETRAAAVRQAFERYLPVSASN